MKRVEDRGGTQIATKVGLFIIPLDAVIDVNYCRVSCLKLVKNTYAIKNNLKHLQALY